MTIETIKKYLEFVTEVKEMAEGVRYWYIVDNNFTIEIVKCEHDLTDKSDFMNLWLKCKYINKPLKTHIAVHTYYTDDNGNCNGAYNITHKISIDGLRRVIDFDYLLEWNEDNIDMLVAECIRMYKNDIKIKE